MQQLLVLSALLLRAAASQISGSGNLSASYGGDARFTCALANATGVLQVTWQRLLEDDSVENLATYSERFGQQVNEPYRGKVSFTEASLGSTSIVLKNLTWADDGCYTCSFNVYPDGSRKKRACLTVRGISEAKTAVQTPYGVSGGEDGGTEDVEFRCSATGRPAPTVEWAFPDETSPLRRPQTTVVANGDGTFTSSRRLRLQVPPSWSGHVDCLLNRGMMGNRQERIHFSSAQRKKEKTEGKSLSASGIALVVCCGIFLPCVAIAAAIWRKRRNGHKIILNPATVNILA